jgi:hypothetical protein
MAEVLSIPAITDKNAKASRTVLQCLIVTHEDYKP